MKILIVCAVLVSALAEPPVDNSYFPAQQSPSESYGVPGARGFGPQRQTDAVFGSRPSSTYGAPSSNSRGGRPSSQYGAPERSQTPSSQFGAPSGQGFGPALNPPPPGFGPSSPGLGPSSQGFGARPSNQYGLPSNQGSGHSNHGSGHSNHGSGHSDHGSGHSSHGSGHSDHGSGHSNHQGSGFGGQGFGRTPSNEYGAPAAPSSQYGAPAGGFGGNQQYSQSGRGGGQSQQYLPPGGGRGGYGGDDGNSEPANYNFEYMVKDDASGNDFGHRESRQGDRTEGRYFVLLPDGRKQIVEYEADQNGYRPKITYEDVGVGGYNRNAQGSQGGYNGQGGQGGYNAQRGNGGYNTQGGQRGYSGQGGYQNGGPY